MIQPTLPIVVYQRKETSMTNISELVHTVSVPEVATDAQIGTQVQGSIEIKRQEEERTEELDLTTKPEEKLAIQTLVTFPATTTPPSQALHRPSVEATPL